MRVANRSSKRTMLTNAMVNWGGFALQLAVAFVLAPILVHGLGSRRYGIWSLVESILMYLTLFDFGVAASVVRFVAKFDATNDRDRQNRVFSTSITIFSIAGLLAIAVAVGFASINPIFLNIPDDIANEARWLMVLLGFNLGVGFPLGVFSCLLDGQSRYPTKNAIRATILGIRSLLLLETIYLHGGLVQLALVITGCSLLEHLAMAVAAYRFFPSLHLSLSLLDRETFSLIRGYGIGAFIIMLAGRISFQTDAIVIGAFLGPVAITFFVIANRLVQYSKDSLRTITQVLTPVVSVLEAQGNEEAIRRTLIETTRYVLWIMFPIQLGLIILGKVFLLLWMGPDYADQSFPVLFILALPMPLVISQAVSACILYGISRLAWLARFTLGEALANLLLSIFLVQSHGIEGVAWGTTVPSALVNGIVAIYICRTLGVTFGAYLRRGFLMPALGAVALALFWIVASQTILIQKWTTLLEVGAVGIMAYATMAIMIELGPEAAISKARQLIKARQRNRHSNPPAIQVVSPGKATK